MKIMKAKKVLRLCVLLFVTGWITAITGCGNKPTTQNNSTSNIGPGPATTLKPKSGSTGSITANPNPIKVCDGTGLGVTNISWDFTGAKPAEVRIGSPAGGLLASAGNAGTKATGKWVGSGTTFYLQDVSNGLPLTADNTIATVAVNVTTQGCP